MTSHAQTNEPDDSVDQAGDQPHSPQTREAQQDEIIEEESGGHR